MSAPIQSDSKTQGVAAPKEGTPSAPAPKPKPVGERPPPNLDARLFNEPFAFDFFQAVRILERYDTARKPVGRSNAPGTEIVRFRSLVSLNFPPSALYDLVRTDVPLPNMYVAFMGLYGPSGILPRHYTELLIRLGKEAKGPEKFALRDFFDLFNHRYISLFYRAWEKYRFFIPYERGEYNLTEPDAYTTTLYSLVGLGFTPTRNRLRVAFWEEHDYRKQEQPLAKIDDLALLYYSGFLSHRPRCSVALATMLTDFFQLDVEIRQFQGQWLYLDLSNQSRLGGVDSNNQLGLNVVAGERVWDVQSKFRVRLGPLNFERFTEFLPDLAPVPQRKAFFLMSHLTRLYVGPEFDFEIQLVLKKEEVPECQLAEGGAIGPRLGWNTWIRTGPMAQDAEQAVFQGEEVIWVDGDQRDFTERPHVEEFSY